MNSPTKKPLTYCVTAVASVVRPWGIGASATSLAHETVLTALSRAVWQRRPQPGLMIHSDRENDRISELADIVLEVEHVQIGGGGMLVLFPYTSRFTQNTTWRLTVNNSRQSRRDVPEPSAEWRAAVVLHLSSCFWFRSKTQYMTIRIFNIDFQRPWPVQK